ncbi:hypothetical protein [Chromohalobacter israelensis]|uniref:hypothetical protein n=1 Tax=Chromohalobacter israelensis TaxID=141390 RepID=UPI000FFE408B|nr:hypothetical protein [Chromohalobacter salexigens]
MIKLLAYRVIPLFLRPLAIIFEGMLGGNSAILVLSLPIAMMALTLSSIPVHIDYYKSNAADFPAEFFKLQYASGLGCLIIISLLALVCIMSIPAFGFGGVFIAITCFSFLLEKQSDEISRALEFRKNFLGWFLVQLLRSGWVFIPLIAAFLGFGYESFYLIFSMLGVVLVTIIFRKVVGFFPYFSMGGIDSIRKNMVFFFGSFLPASYRQLPRILIARMYPEQAHAFIALSQFSQGVGVLFNVRFQIPYRKIIARRPLMFQRILEPVMKKILLIPAVVVFLYIATPIYLDLSTVPSLIQSVFFLPVVIADALVFSILSAHLGYIHWFANKLSAMWLYTLCMALAVVVLGALSLINYPDLVNLAGIPVATMIVGFIWLLYIKMKFFSGSKKWYKAHG